MQTYKDDGLLILLSFKNILLWFLKRLSLRFYFYGKKAALDLAENWRVMDLTPTLPDNL